VIEDNNKLQKKGSKELLEEVINQGLCTGCGACITGCPYMAAYNGKVVVLDKCTGIEGDCYKHCPRTPTDVEVLSQEIFGTSFGATEIGHFEQVFMARSTNSSIREKGQDGGCVTALLSLALEEGLVDVVACSKMDSERVPRGFLARNKEELLSCAGSSYEASYSLEAYRNLPKENTEKIAVVGVPCQIEALSKIKIMPPENSPNPKNIKLTIGLFCGWALSPRTFHPFLEHMCNINDVSRFDIPHTPNYCFDVHMSQGEDLISRPLDEIKPYINPACDYCWDMTAEFSDISVGSAGSAFSGWNTVVVRNSAGAELIELARKKGILETQDLPSERFDHLKEVAIVRKKKALNQIIKKSGSKDDLIYIKGLNQEYIDKIMK
jgi:coenzyme F420 hydrogenase subunit beta